MFWNCYLTHRNISHQTWPGFIHQGKLPLTCHVGGRVVKHNLISSVSIEAFVIKFNVDISLLGHAFAEWRRWWMGLVHFCCGCLNLFWFVVVLTWPVWVREKCSSTHFVAVLHNMHPWIFCRYVHNRVDFFRELFFCNPLKILYFPFNTIGVNNSECSTLRRDSVAEKNQLQRVTAAGTNFVTLVCC